MHIHPPAPLLHSAWNTRWGGRGPACGDGHCWVPTNTSLCIGTPCVGRVTRQLFWFLVACFFFVSFLGCFVGIFLDGHAVFSVEVP